MPSVWQIALVVLLIVLLFGRGKISDLMGDVAKGIRSFKKGLSEEPQDESEPEPAPKNVTHAKSETKTPSSERPASKVED